jgi:hypothetical protein
MILKKAPSFTAEDTKGAERHELSSLRLLCVLSVLGGR